MKKNQGEGVTAEQVYEDLQRLVRDSEALLKATADNADDQVQSARAKAKATMDAAKERIGDLEDDVLGRVRDIASQGQAYLRDNPWATVAVAGVVGFLLGALLTRRQSDD